MNTPTPAQTPPVQVQSPVFSQSKTLGYLLFGLLFCLWMFPGLMVRDPWKADEAYSYGLVLNMMETGNWVVPTLGADPFMEKPPICYITSALFGKLFSPPFQLHEAFRLSAAFYLALTLIFVAAASRELNAKGSGWVAAVLFLGCVGNLHTGHMLVTDNSLLTGFALALYGLALGLRRPWIGGLVCGTGLGLAFLSKGMIGPGMIGLAMMALPAFPAWRNRNYLRVLVGAALASLPWLTIWPWLLYERSPALFRLWFWNNNVERFMGVGLGVSNTTPLHYFKEWPWFALPVWPLALWTVWRERRGVLRNPSVMLPLVYFLAITLVLSAAGQRRGNYAPPIFPPLCLLAVRSMGCFDERTVARINRVLFAVFSFAALMMWFSWVGLFFGFPHQALEAIRRLIPGFAPKVYPGLLAGAIVLTAAWVLLIRWHRRECRWLAAHWTAGLALAYGLAMTLWLPVSNGNMSYRDDFAGLREALGPNPGVVAGRRVEEPQRAMVHLFGGVRLYSEEIRGPVDANWILVQGSTKRGKEVKSPGPDWQLVWQGNHHEETFHLYRKSS